MEQRRVVLCLLVLVSLSVAACSSGASTLSRDSGGADCRNYEPPTAGNHLIGFLGAVQHGRAPEGIMHGGLEDPFGCAYAQLCQAQRDRVSEEVFKSSAGEAISEMLSADTHAGPSVYVDRGLSEERDGMETLDRDLQSTWIEVEANWFEHVDDRTTVIGSVREEHWRVDLVREDADWRPCQFTPIPPTFTCSAAEGSSFCVVDATG